MLVSLAAVGIADRSDAAARPRHPRRGADHRRARHGRRLQLLLFRRARQQRAAGQHRHRRRRAAVAERRSLAPQDHRVQLSLLVRSVSRRVRAAIVPGARGLARQSGPRHARRRRRPPAIAGRRSSHDFADCDRAGREADHPGRRATSAAIAARNFPASAARAKLTPIFEQAYRQGARIHSNSWGDRQGQRRSDPPTRELSAVGPRRRCVRLVASRLAGRLQHRQPRTGRGRRRAARSPRRAARRTRCRSAARAPAARDDDTLAYFTLFGPARDGRIKPDLVAPARVLAGDRDFDENPTTCDVSHADRERRGLADGRRCGRAGAAVLHRRFLSDRHGSAVERIHAERRAAEGDAHRRRARRADARRHRDRTTVAGAAGAVARAGLGLSRCSTTRSTSRATRAGCTSSTCRCATASRPGSRRRFACSVNAGTPLKAVLVWTDPPGHIAPVSRHDAAARERSRPARHDVGGTTLGNGSDPDRLNNVEVVSHRPRRRPAVRRSPSPRIDLGFGPRQSYALVITGDFDDADSVHARHARSGIDSAIMRAPCFPVSTCANTLTTTGAR